MLKTCLLSGHVYRIWTGLRTLKILQVPTPQPFPQTILLGAITPPEGANTPASLKQWKSAFLTHLFYSSSQHSNKCAYMCATVQRQLYEVRVQQCHVYYKLLWYCCIKLCYILGHSASYFRYRCLLLLWSCKFFSAKSSEEDDSQYSDVELFNM